VVVLDPGHNRDNGAHPAEINRMVDAGGFAKACNTAGTATDDGVPEATVNWELALQLRERLTDLGARVVLTRDANAGWGPCIDERAAVANRAHADLLLSLHADGAAASGRGFHVIMPGVSAGWTDDIAGDSREAAVLVRDALVAAGNPEAAELAGIRTRWVMVRVFILMGALAGLSAAIGIARLNAATNAQGTLDELLVIAAAVIGGTSFAGGIGTIAGAMIGAVVMQSLQSGMVLIGIESPMQSIVVGTVLVLAVWIDTIYRRRAK